MLCVQVQSIFIKEKKKIQQMARKSSLRHQKQLSKLSIVWGERETEIETSLHFNILAHYIFICIGGSLSYVTKYILTYIHWFLNEKI